jgi:hypothetical protein
VEKVLAFVCPLDEKQMDRGARNDLTPPVAVRARQELYWNLSQQAQTLYEEPFGL